MVDKNIKLQIAKTENLYDNSNQELSTPEKHYFTQKQQGKYNIKEK